MKYGIRNSMKEPIDPPSTQPLGQLKRVNGVLVITGSGRVTQEDLVDQSRDERMDDLMSGSEQCGANESHH
jgi:hypothetical protein